MAHGLSCSMACGIFPEQISNLCPLHWQAGSYALYHQGSNFLRQCMMVLPGNQVFILKLCSIMSVQWFYDYLNISIHFALVILEKLVELKRLKANMNNMISKA